MSSVVTSGRDAVRRFAYFQNQAKQAGRKLGLDCWLWQGALTPNGYGMFRYFDPKTLKHVSVVANKTALEVHLGRELLPGMVSAHICPGVTTPDRRCCNPAHLAEQSQSQNVQTIATEKVREAGSDLVRTTSDYRTGKPAKTAEEIDALMPEVHRLRALKWPWAEIAAKLDVSHTAIYKRYRIAGGVGIGRRTTEEVEALYEQIKTMREAGATWKVIAEATKTTRARAIQLFMDTGRRKGEIGPSKGVGFNGRGLAD